MSEDKITNLYNTFVSEGYEMESEGEFRDNLKDPAKRKSAYDSLVSDGYEMEPFEDFERNIGFGSDVVPQPHQSVQQQPEQSVSQPQQTEAEANGEEKPQTESTLTKAMHQFQREQTQIPFEQTPVQERMLNNSTKARAAQGIDPATGMLNGVSRIIKEQPGYIEPFEGKYDENAEDFDYGKLMSNMHNNYARSNNAVNKKAWADNEYDKMMREFEKSDRYNEIVSKYRNEYNSGKMTLDDATKQMNEDLSIEFNLTYENELDEIAQSIQQDMFDYNKAYFEHHKNRLDKRQTATDTDNMIATYEKEREKFVENSEYFNPSDVLDPYHYNPNARQRKISRDEINYTYALDILKKSKQMQDAAKNQSGFWKGLGDMATDADIWTLGLSELARNSQLTDVLEKSERDEQLTASEQALLDASLNQTLTTAFYANDLRGWYKAGQTTAMSIPFMLEVAATSMIGGGFVSALGKRIFKASMKNAGKSAYRKVLAKAAAGATTSLAETGMQTAMFGGGHIAAGTKQRMIGDLKGYYDLEGNATYAGRENMQGFGEALWNSTADYVSENLVERTGGMLKIGGHFAGPLSSKVASKFANTKIGKIYNEVLNNPFSKATHIGGYLEEFDEEVATMLLKPLLSTDSTVKDEMTLQNMKDTALGLLPTQIGFGLLGAGNYGVNSIKKANAIKANINAFNNMLTESEQQIFSEYRKLFNGKKAKLAGEEGRELFGQLIDEINNSDANDVEKVAKIAKLMQLTRDMQLPYEAMPETEEELTGQINNANGYAITDPQEMNDAQNMYEMQRKKMIDAGFAEEDLDSYDDSQLILYAKNMSESGVNPQTAQTIIDYINAKQTYDGMTQRVRDDIDTEVEASNAEIASHVNKETGRIQTATLKEDDRQVYIISGEVKTFDDGTGVDTATSDHSIVVQDAATGKMEFVSPDAILNVGEEQDPTTLQNQARQEIEERRAQTAVDAMNGTVTQFNEGDKYTVTIEQEGKDPQQVEVEIVPNEQGIIDNGDGTVNVKDTDGQIVPLPKETIQKAVDEANMARAIEFETQKTEERLAAQQQQQPTRPEYSRNAQIKLRDDNGNEVRATIDDVNDDGFVVHLEDAATGRWRAVEMSRDELDERITEYEGQRIEQQEEKKGDTLQTAASKPHGGISLYRDIIANVLEVEKPLSGGKGTNNSSEKQYPRDKKGNLILHEMETSDAVDEIEGIGNDALAAKLVENNLNKARKELDGLKKKTDNVTTAEEMKALSAQINDAEAKVRAWEKINNERSRRASERNAQNMPSVQQELQAAQEKRQAEREQAMHEQQEAGFHVAGAQAKAKFANAPKVEGNTATRTLPNGEKITGRYVLTTPDALTPSHDPLNNFSKSDGFPLNENGTTVNDRDYQADQSAQNHTRLIAQQYDGQAVEQVPVVTQDGIVLDGNGRTMAGQLAAQNGTDAQYTQALAENAQNFGFTPEQVQSIPHARVVFVADQAMPYTTETLAKFNVNEKKTQSNTETAIANAKKLSVDTITKIADIIDEYATIDSFFASENAMAELFTLLQNEGVIGTNEIAGLFEGNTLNARGREYVTNLLIGSMFTEETIRSLAGNNDLKRTLVRATKQILANAKLGDYSLFDEINRAIELKHEADMLGSSVKLHLGQQNMFEEAASERYTEFEQMLAIALETGVEEFRTILDDYNREASPLAGGQLNIFTGEVTPKSEVIKTITEYYADRIKSKGKSATEQQPTDRAGHQADAAAQGVETRSRKGAERDGAVVAPDRGGETTGRGISEVGGQGTQGSVLQGTPTEDIRQIQAERELENGLSEEEATALMKQMESNAGQMPQIELNPKNWAEQFGDDGKVTTPIGVVKIGNNQITKLFEKGRSQQFGMIKPTLESPHVIVEVESNNEQGETERGTSYLFVRAFVGADGKKIYYFKSVTVSKDGMEVSISSHFDRSKRIKDALENGKLLYRFDGGAQTEHRPADVSVATSPELEQGVSSTGKGSEKSENSKEIDGKIAQLGEIVSQIPDGTKGKELNIDYNGKSRRNVLAGDSAASQQRKQGSAGDASSGERTESGEQPSDSAGGTQSDSGRDDVRGNSLLDAVKALYEKGKEYASKVFGMKFFDVAKTPDFMKNLGLSGEKFTIRYGVISRHIGKDSEHNLPQEVWEQLPEALQKPFAIAKLTDKEDSYRIYTTIRTDKGGYVVVGADVKNAGRDIDVNAISTVFGRREDANLPKNEKVVYTSKDITPEQSSLLNEPNSRQYPTAQELSESKGSKKSENSKEIDGKIAEEESKVNVNPTDAQKEAGNYKKGHIQLGIFDITIEQPRDSIRRGTDADGKEWESKMYYTYGYIKGTEGADGDHIDVFLAHDMENWEEKPVFVVDQYNEDGTFDEHKVMLGFATAEDARTAYLANYEKGWEKKHRIDIGVITLDEFENWIGSSHRKTKPFAEYKSVKNVNVSLKEQETESGQTTETNSAEQQGGMSDVQQEVFDAVSEMLADAGIEVEVLTNEQMDELAGRSGTTLHARINALHSAAQTIKSWLKNGTRGKVFELNLPQRTIAMIRKAMGRDFDSHNITSNSIVHILKNHGVNGTKLQSNSIPLREEDVELIPYIMTAPDRVEKSSTDGTNRDSVRFYKTLSNGYVVVVEKEYKNSPNDMETITMWAELSSAATNAQSNKTAPDTLVRNAIRSTDAAKIRKDAETAIAEDENIEKRQEKAKEEAIDKEYFAAIERGDMEEVQRLVNQRADEAGYTPESDYQGTSAFNGAAPSSSAYYDTKEERLEALNTDEFEGDVSLGDMIDAPGSYVVGGIEDFAELQLRRGSATARESASAILDAINSGKRKITVYRSIPADIKETKLRNGDWVTLNRDYAKENAYIHGWKGKIIEEEVDIDNLWWDGNDINEWGYDDGKAYAYQNTKNNRKLLDPITYDERGNIIPLSKRFNKRSPLPQLMTVYHGSGASFDAFDHSHMGEGEGAQAYGWGSYVTEVEGIGRTYAETTGGKDVRNRINRLGSHIDSKKDFIKTRKSDIRKNEDYDKYAKTIQKNLKDLQKEYKAAEKAGNEKDMHFYQSLINIAEQQLEPETHKNLIDSFWNDINDAQTDIDRSTAEMSDLKKQLKQIKRNLYTVEIPDNNGSNYLEWEKKPNKRIVSKCVGKLIERGQDLFLYGNGFRRRENREGETQFDLYNNEDLYNAIRDVLGSDKAASEFLSSLGFTGISYPAQYQSGGRYDGARNYVIFNEKDLRITEHVQFLKNGKGTVYGATMGGKIYLNGSAMNPETPIHEYTHIWDKACRKSNPELWARGVELMKQTPLWDEVKNDPNYSDLKTDDEIASEVHSRLTGKDGAQTMERMVEESRKNGIIANARSVTLREQLRTWLSDFWYWLKDTMTPWSKAEADRVSLKDFINMPVADLVKGTDLKAGNGMTAEQNRIIEQAKKDGTYMKAPNGKPSNLSPRQWVQVRTRAFKKWFGDWEKAARIEKLRNSKAVEISGEEITPSEDLKQYKKNALEYGKKLQGIYTNKDTGNEIQLQRGRKNGGINEVLQHNYKDVEHLQSIAAIPQIISESVYIDSEQNRDRGKNPNVAEYQHFVCGLKIGGVDYTVHSAIAVDKSGNRYYDHNLTRIEKTELLDFIDQAAAVEDFGTMPDTKSTILSNYKGKQLISLLQTNSSKFIDENGEPKVFYHNTDNEFTAFNPEKNGTKTDAGWLGDGFYFYGDESEGNGYGKNKMAVFLNVREPYYATSEENNRLAEADDRETSIDFRNEIESEGYDGVYYNGDLRQEAVVFSPTQIKSATDNVGEFDGGSPDIRFQFIGERGAENMDKAEEVTTRLDNLGTAREMETAGKDAKTIKMATGWERGADGKWRYETPDGKFDRDGNLHPERYKLSESEQEELDSAFDETMQAFEKGALLYDKEIDADTDMVEIYVAGGMEKGKAQRIMDLENKERKLSRQNKKLDDYLDNEELFKTYPQLRDIEVEEDPNAPLFHFGSYNPETNTIKLNFKSNDVLLHEVQHIIQRIEGFSTGGSPSSIASARHQIRSNRNIIRNLFNDLGFREWYAKQSDTDKAQWANSTQEFAAEYAFAAGNNALIEKLDEGRKLINEALEIIGNEQKSNGLGSTEVYNRLAGEVEARNVERRMGMSIEERRASLAEETEDVAREDQIFIKNALNEARKADDDVMFRESEGSYTTGSGDTIEFTHDGGLLENAEDGEFCLVERAFTENGYFGFTASHSKIKTVQDVAYIFRKLEDKAVENSFAVLVKEGRPTIIHLGMGTQGETLVDASAIRLAYDKFGADKIYFVHNHPSGKLVASRQDVEMIRRIRRMFPDGVVEDGIIIDLNSGKFGTFNEMGSDTPQEHKAVTGKREGKLDVLTFDRQVFAKDFDISKLQQIRSSEDIAAFLSSQRLGARQKMSVLLLNNQNQIIGNYHLPFAGINDEQLADEIVRLAIASGARNVVPYGNFTLDRAQVRNLKEMISNLTDRNVTLLDCISVDNGLNTMSAADEGLIYEPTEAYRPTRQGESRQRDVERIVKEGGIVTPGLNEMETAVVEADADHGFSNFNEAKNWAKENIARVYDNTETGGKGTIRISNSAIDKYMSQSAVDKSDSKDVHMSVLKVLPEILKESIDAEQHADYQKDANGNRSAENDVNNNIIVHRLYGAARIGDKTYRVKVTLKEDVTSKDAKVPHSYEATKIELLAGTLGNSGNSLSPNTSNSISAAKLLKDVEKSYDKGKKLLDESEKADSRAEQLCEGEHETPTTAYQQRKQMRQRVEELVERLHLDNVEIVTDTTTLDGKKAKGKGFYNKRTGKITIVLPNNTSLADVEQTLLHEAVAHHGLRQMFGKNLNNFLDSVYENASDDVKRKINKLAINKYGYDFRTATEEYLASLAERTNFEEAKKSGWWKKVKAMFVELLEKVGFVHLKGEKLTDNELRYILWRSYENLKGGKHSGILAEAADIAMQYDLGTGEYADTPKAVNDRFNEELDDFKANRHEGLLHLGRPSAKLRACGINAQEMTLSPRVLHTHLKKHNLTTDDLKGLAKAIQNPILVYKHGLTSPNIVVVTELNVKGGKLSASFLLNSNGDVVEINNISSIHSKDAAKELERIYMMGEKDFQENLRWAEKEKVLDWLAPSSYENSGAQGNQETFDIAKVINSHKNPSVSEENILFRELADEVNGLKDNAVKTTRKAYVDRAKGIRAANNAAVEVGKEIKKLYKVASLQKEYDINTVKSLYNIINKLIDNKLLDDVSLSELKRILSSIKNATGAKETSRVHTYSNAINQLINLIADNQIRNGREAFENMLKVKPNPVDAKGVEKLGALDEKGKQTLKKVREYINLPLTKRDANGELQPDCIESKLNDAAGRMKDANPIIAENAQIEYDALVIARQYANEIAESKTEEKELRDELEAAKLKHDAGQIDDVSYRELRKTLNDAILENKLNRADAYNGMIERTGEVINGSAQRAENWHEQEKRRIEEIHHNANSDMQGRPAAEHTGKDNDKITKIVNNSAFQFLFKSQATFDQMLRLFGNKSVRGEGYLYNRYMRGWLSATEKEYIGNRDAYNELNAKASQVFGREMQWSDLFAVDRKLKDVIVSFFNDGEKRETVLTQGNALYIYMANKMIDGKMKLRAMGISELDVEKIKEKLDPRLITLADWLQDEFLPSKRQKYNEVYKRMFGVSMAEIDNYFPLKINQKARTTEVDVAEDNEALGLPSTTTGNIVKRKRNTLALDITNANAFSVILDHIRQMEHWAAFAEWNRDLNTLLSYKHFRNQVLNMKSVYGSGQTLWNNFRDVSRLAAGAYRPKQSDFDQQAVNMAKGVSAAKVNFRLFTAMKQFLSIPAFLSDTDPATLGKNMVHPVDSWTWAMENLPLFEKRWQSRMAGDPRLMKTEMDWKMWQTKVVEISSRIGMSPNAFVDALTVSIGAYSVYECRKRHYKKLGFDEKYSEEHAKQDATIAFNQTQQSSESVFLSTMQVDRTWASVLFSVFRNSSMAYTRQLYDALRNLGRMSKKGYKEQSIEFMKKQFMREGLTEEQAAKAAAKEFRKGLAQDTARVAIFGYGIQFLWNLGSYLPYLIFGDDDDEKDKMLSDAAIQAIFGGLEGLVGGDVMSIAGLTLIKSLKGEDVNWQYLTKDMPLSSDIESMLRHLSSDKALAMNDVVNILVQMGVGVNPQTLTDVVAAMIDAFGNDTKAMFEAGLLIGRIINVPQSQLDKIYFDEIDMDGTEAKKMSPKEIVERYAAYKAFREAPFTNWVNKEEREGKKQRQAEKIVKDKFKKTKKFDEFKKGAEKGKAKSDRLNEAIKDGDADKAREIANGLSEDNTYNQYRIMNDYNRYANQITKLWLNTKTAEERQRAAELLIGLQDRIVDEFEKVENN